MPARSVTRPSSQAAGGPRSCWQWLLVSLAVVLGVYAAFVAWLVILGRRDDARALATFIPQPARNAACPEAARFTPPQAGAGRAGRLPRVAVDLVPDFIPVAGQLDDAIVVALVLRSFVRSSGKQLIRELWPGPEQSLELILRLAQPGT